MTIEEILRKLEKIKNNLTEYDYTDLTFMLNELLPSIPVSVITLKMESDQPVLHESLNFKTLFRARPHEDHLSSVSYPTLSNISYVKEKNKHKLKGFGRVNKPEKPVFYCSTEIVTACMEGISKGVNLERLNKDWTYWLTVGQWKLKEDLTLAEVIKSPDALITLQQKAPGLNIQDRDIECTRKYYEATRKKVNDDRKFALMDFFAKEFAKTKIDDDMEYMLSNYYADRMLNKIDGFEMQSVDGIIYPSVPRAYDDKNIVIDPDVVDRKLEFLGATKMKVTYIPGQMINFESMQAGFGVKADKDGNLEWKVF